MNWKKQGNAVDSILEFGADEVESMSSTTFCSRVLAEFLKHARSFEDKGCTIIDYSQLDQAAIESTARLFGIAVTDEGREAIRVSIDVYSKDSNSSRKFEDDRESKRARASNTLRMEIDGWARIPYEQARALDVSVA